MRAPVMLSSPPWRSWSAPGSEPPNRGQYACPPGLFRARDGARGVSKKMGAERSSRSVWKHALAFSLDGQVEQLLGGTNRPAPGVRKSPPRSAVTPWRPAAKCSVEASDWSGRCWLEEVAYGWICTTDLGVSRLPLRALLSELRTPCVKCSTPGSVSCRPVVSGAVDLPPQLCRRACREDCIGTGSTIGRTAAQHLGLLHFGFLGNAAAAAWAFQRLPFAGGERGDAPMPAHVADNDGHAVAARALAAELRAGKAAHGYQTSAASMRSRSSAQRSPRESATRSTWTAR